MITVEITDSNMVFFEEFDLADRISYLDFHEICSDLEQDEFLKFTLYENEEPFYQGTFDKKNGKQSVTEDIFSVLDRYQKQKKIDRKQKKEFQKKIRQALKATKETKTEKIPDESAVQETRSKRQAIPILYKTMIFFICAIAILAIAFTVRTLFGEDSKSIPKSGDAYEQLLSNKQYILAAEEYPKKKDETTNYLIEEILQSNETIDELEKYYHSVSSAFKKLDMLLLTHDFSAAIAEYEKAGFSFDERQLLRGTLVGHAYLKNDQLEKAETISQEINSPELEKYIARYTQYQLQINGISKKIEELEKDPVEHKEEIINLIDQLYDTKLELEKL